jgi:hypothetical protein
MQPTDNLVLRLHPIVFSSFVDERLRGSMRGLVGPVGCMSGDD